MAPLTYLITGANRGLGLEFVRQILAGEPDSRVIAAAREPAKADALLKLAADHKGRVETLKLDVVSAEVLEAGWVRAAVTGS